MVFAATARDIAATAEAEAAVGNLVTVQKANVIALWVSVTAIMVNSINVEWVKRTVRPGTMALNCLAVTTLHRSTFPLEVLT